jgi:ABC-type antimicrobial peptide transport system ATPase subunit
LALRAVSFRFDTASLMGININRIISFTFIVGSCLAAMAGILYAVKYPKVEPLMGLLPETVKSESGEILFDGKNLLSLSPTEWFALRGRRIAMVFQEPMTALNPVMRIGDQIAEMFEAHNLLTPKERRQKALALIGEVGLPAPERIADPSHWVDLLCRHKVTLWNSVPSQVQMLVDHLGSVRQDHCRLRHDPLDDFGCGQDVVDQINTFASPHDARGEIVRRRRQIGGFLRLPIRRQLLK